MSAKTLLIPHGRVDREARPAAVKRIEIGLGVLLGDHRQPALVDVAADEIRLVAVEHGLQLWDRPIPGSPKSP